MSVVGSGSTGSITPLSGSSNVEDTEIISSSTLGKNVPSYVSMTMSSEPNNLSRITVSPCVGNPTVFGSPYDVHPTATSAKFSYTDVNSAEFEITVAEEITGVGLHDIVWYFNIFTSTDNSLQYELYPNNNHLRPSCYQREISMLTPSSAELENGHVKFAVEFEAFGIPYEVIQSSLDIEIRYRLYGFNTQMDDTKPSTACAAILSGQSVFVNVNTGTDYLAFNKTTNTGKLRILGNKGGVDFNKMKNVQVVGEYTLPNGLIMHSSTGFATVKVYEGFPWWGILIIVLLVLILIGGAVAAVIVLKRHRKRQGDYLLNANENEAEVENPEDGEYVANFDTMN
eukprot:gnl/Chilomastix_caulleri/856.p1 GENE.gnl/Chilomastix_caulleri/856~~gnl/Chilomastix_caulleri/856.p1  ORF type:complete len:341 (+),score=107.03 gnl/Chilomastix_caulleri/856:66-1088(+)